MSKRTLRLPSPALVIATVALALVLGGTAVAASVGGDTKADTKLIKKLAPTLSVKHATSADALANVSYVKGNVVDAPPNGGAGFAESSNSTATCPPYTVLIGTAAYTGGEGVDVSAAGVLGPPPNAAKDYFDNFTNNDYATNYAIAICAAATSETNPAGLAVKKISRR